MAYARGISTRETHVERELALPGGTPEDPLSREAGPMARNGLSGSNFRISFFQGRARTGSRPTPSVPT
jgi:hypothetical protein